MQNREPLTNQLLQIMQELNKNLDRKQFCEIHHVSESKLSRILSGKIQPDFELLDYMAMHSGKQIKISLS